MRNGIIFTHILEMRETSYDTGMNLISKPGKDIIRNEYIGSMSLMSIDGKNPLTKIMQ